MPVVVPRALERQDVGLVLSFGERQATLTHGTFNLYADSAQTTLRKAAVFESKFRKLFSRGTSMKPPDGLKSAGIRLWEQYVSEYDLETDAHAVRLLQTACEHADIAAFLQSAIDKDGAVLTDRFGQPKPHSAVKELRSERQAMIACLKALGVDLEPIGDGMTTLLNTNGSFLGIDSARSTTE